MQALDHRFVSSIFSDETPEFLMVPDSKKGGNLRIRIRLQKDEPVKVYFLSATSTYQGEMEKAFTDTYFDWYEKVLPCPSEKLYYSFLISWNGAYILYQRSGVQWVDSIPALDNRKSFRFIPGFHIPAWAKGSVQYQIFPDRFCNGNPSNDVTEGEYYYSGGLVHHIASWDEAIHLDDYRCFYGGDLQGIWDKLDYLQSLGVETLYLNPIFISPSPHGYDTQDYDYIDPHLTQIKKDLPRNRKNVVEGTDNRTAKRYILRTTNPENLEASNAFFADFCAEIHRRGMKIILDGVFNHCGSFNRWMNREKLYGEREGAYGHPDSPTRNYFRFIDPTKYEEWWGIETLPKLNYETCSELCEAILKIGEKWVSPPYNVDGWRLDVGADIGHGPEINHAFWKQFRARVKKANPNAVILAEHYGDPFDWLQGDEWDTVMNYDAFMDPLSFFLTGMEKHSDYRRDDLYQNGVAFFDTIFENMSRYPIPSLQCSMNQLDNHDHSRFLTRTNGWTGRLADRGPQAASEGIRKSVFKEAAAIQMTWPGSPTLYYGDEAGLCGWTDPDNRRTYPWGQEDKELITMYRTLSEIRKEFPVLKDGSIKPLCAGWGHIAYARFNADHFVIVVCNNQDYPMEMWLPLRDIGIADGTEIISRYCTSDPGAVETGSWVETVRDGYLPINVRAESVSILIAKTSRLS